MFDTLQFVVKPQLLQLKRNDATNVRYALACRDVRQRQPTRKHATNVRYALACRRSHHHSTSSQWLNECPICFSLSSLSSPLNFIAMTQRMSDMLQLVVARITTQPHRNDSTDVRHEQFRLGWPVMRVNDKLKSLLQNSACHALAAWYFTFAATS